MQEDTLIYKEYLQAKELVLMNHSFDINKFIYIKKNLNIFLAKNPNYTENNVINSFLDDKFHLSVFALALFGEKEINNLLNDIFKKFYFEYRFIAYISKTLYFEAIDFDRKNRKTLENEPVILDMPISGDSNLKLSDTIFREEPELELKSSKFDDCIIDENLYVAYKSLKEKQQKILYYSYYSQLKDAEIAKRLNVSKQAVSKSRIKSLNTLKISLRGG